MHYGYSQLVVTKYKTIRKKLTYSPNDTSSIVRAWLDVGVLVGSHGAAVVNAVVVVEGGS